MQIWTHYSSLVGKPADAFLKCGYRYIPHKLTTSRVLKRISDTTCITRAFHEQGHQLVLCVQMTAQMARQECFQHRCPGEGGNLAHLELGTGNLTHPRLHTGSHNVVLRATMMWLRLYTRAPEAVGLIPSPCHARKDSGTH